MIDTTGVSSSNGISMAWPQIVAVSAHKIDAKTKILTYLVFDHECGEYMEFTNEDPEFQAIVDGLDRYLELPSGWKGRIDAATPEDGILELWKKGEDN